MSDPLYYDNPLYREPVRSIGQLGLVTLRDDANWSASYRWMPGKKIARFDGKVIPSASPYQSES